MPDTLTCIIYLHGATYRLLMHEYERNRIRDLYLFIEYDTSWYLLCSLQYSRMRINPEFLTTARMRAHRK